MVVIGEVAVGDGDGGGRLDDVDQPVGASRHGDMVDPDILGAEEGDPIAVARRPLPDVVDGVPDHAAPPRFDVVDLQAVDDHVPHVLDGDAGAVGDLDGGAAAVDGLVALDDQLLGQRDDHVVGEGDPQRALLDDGVPQGSGPRVPHVVVR